MRREGPCAPLAPVQLLRRPPDVATETEIAGYSLVMINWRLANAGVVMEFLESCSLSDVLRLAPALLQDGSTQGRAAAHLLVRLRECVDDCVEAYSAIIRLIHTYYSPEPAFCVEFIGLLDETMFPASVVSSLSHMIVEPLPHAQLQRLVNKLSQLAANDRALLVPTIGALGELPLTADLRDQVRAQA